MGVSALNADTVRLVSAELNGWQTQSFVDRQDVVLVAQVAQIVGLSLAELDLSMACFFVSGNDECSQTRLAYVANLCQTVDNTTDSNTQLLVSRFKEVCVTSGTELTVLCFAKRDADVADFAVDRNEEVFVARFANEFFLGFAVCN